MPNEPALPRHFLRRCLLLLLGERADHGYDLVESLAPFGFDGSDPGGVYRALRVMEHDKLVHSVWRPSGAGPYRRVYELTEAGRRELAHGAREIAHAYDFLDIFLDRYARLVAVPRKGEVERRVPGPPDGSSTTSDPRGLDRLA